jgi:hypothetical protein
MKKRRNLGHLSPELEMGAAIKRWFDTNDLSGSAISQVFESRLDDVEDSQATLADSLADEVTRAKAAEAALSSEQVILSSSISTFVDDLTSLSSSISTINTDVASLSSSLSSSISIINTDVASLSSSVASLSQSLTLLSASIGSGGGLAVSGTAELSFNGDTLMTDADVYISGSGNNLYLHGTNDQGNPAKFEFSIINGGTIIQEVPHTDFGDEIDDPWFKFDGDTLLTHADIYVSGSNNYLYLNGTDENGDYGIFYFDIIDGRVIVKQTGSIN